MIATDTYAVIAGTCDVSQCTACQSTLIVSVSRWAMLWETSAVKACVRCVGVLALALELILWPTKQLECTGTEWNSVANISSVLSSPLPFFFSLLIILYLSYTLLFLSLCWVTVLSLSVPCRQAFWPETKGWCGCGLVWVKPLPRSSREQWKELGAATGQVWWENPLHIRKVFRRLVQCLSSVHGGSLGRQSLYG